MSDNRKSFTPRDMLTSGGNGDIGCATPFGYVTARYQGGEIVCVTVDEDRFVPGSGRDIPVPMTRIAESKVRQLGGDVCGVLVRKDGKLAAVDEHGRVQWLRGEQGADPVAWCHEKVFAENIGRGHRFEGTTRKPEGVHAVGMVPLYTHPQPAQQSNQEDVIALLTNALANIRDTDASAKTLQSMAALALKASKETCDD